MKYTFVTLFLIICCGLSWSQSLEYEGYATPISELFDIGNTDLNDIGEDWNGFIWMATNNGLYRFDGTILKHFTYSANDTSLLHPHVYDFLIDHERQELWIATSSGLTRLDPASGRFRHYTTDYKDPNSLPDDVVRYLYKDEEGQLWIGCYNRGLALYREASDDFVHYHFEVPQIDSLQKLNATINQNRLNSYKYIIADKKNKDLFWMASPIGLVTFNKKSKIFNWPLGQRPDHSFLYPENSVTRIYPLEDKLLIGTIQKNYIYDIEKDLIQVIPMQGEEKKLRFVTNLQAVSDSIYSIAYGNGMAFYNIYKNRISAAWLDKVELGQYYGTRLIDSKQRAWVNSSKALIMYDPLKQFTRTHLLDQDMRSTPKVLKELDEKSVFMLTRQSGYYHIFDRRKRKWRSEKMKVVGINWPEIEWRDMVKLNENQFILLDKSRLYLLDIRNQRLSLFHQEIGRDASPDFYRIILDAKNQIWAASIRMGLFKINLETGDYVQYLDELNSNFYSSLYTWITDLFEDLKGNIWIRLARSYAVYHPDTDKFEFIFHNEKAEQTFRYVQNFAQSSKGELWMSSVDKGIGQADAEKIGNGVTKKLSDREGLLSNRISRIDFDEEDLLWILSDKGLSTYDIENDTIQNFAWDRGIPKSKLFTPLSDGKIGLAVQRGGIAILDPTLIQKDRIAPDPYIRGVKVKDRHRFKAGNRRGLKYLQVNSSRDYLSFEFSALGFSNPKQFAYQLEGVDSDWVLTSQHSSTSYSNLSPGSYKFLLKARMEGGEWSDEKVLNVNLAPYWWETWWFRLFSLAFLGALVYGVYRWRLEDVRQKERIKADFQHKLDEVEMQMLRSQMNPHFLFNSLNSIQHYIIKNKAIEASEYLDRFAWLIRLILQNSRAKEIPLKNDLEALQLYADLENLRFKNKFDYYVQIAPEINTNNINIPPMMLQPFVENAIWHGFQHKNENGTIQLNIRLQGDQLICSIEDDGIGREASAKFKRKSNKPRKSMGMTITHNRIDILNQTHDGVAGIEIEDLYDENKKAKGTRVIVRLPII